MTRLEDVDSERPLEPCSLDGLAADSGDIGFRDGARQLRVSSIRRRVARQPAAAFGVAASAGVLLCGAIFAAWCRHQDVAEMSSSKVEALQSLAAAPHALEKPSSPAEKPGRTYFSFNCSAGFSGWQHEWSQLKKDFCCDEEKRGCEHRTAAPFDCDAGYSDWRGVWPLSKTGYCCYHRGRGCERFGGVSEKQLEEQAKCSAVGEDCMKTQCCKDAGLQCFSKNNFWAECLETCSAGPNILDQESAAWWQCRAIGQRTPGKRASGRCSGHNEDCRSTQCCSEPGMQCFQKNSLWASCKASCTPGPDLYGNDPDLWSCKTLGPRTEGAAPWISQVCANSNEDCSHKGCCMESNHQCFRKDNGYAQCKTECKPGFKANPWEPAWSCAPVGMRTPQLPPPPDAKGVVSKWVADTCSGEGDNCLKTQCCKPVGLQCYKKSEYWGACQNSCEPGVDKDNKTITCEPLGKRSWGLAMKGYPSLYCFSLYMPQSKERLVMEAQLRMNAGIFGCDGYDVFASTETILGRTKDLHLVEAILIPNIKVGVSQDGTAGNAQLFMAVWDKIIAQRKFTFYDWTIKVDPDAAIIPWRMRDHLRWHVGKNAYVVNCNKFPGSPNFPMMYGAVEVFSMQAMYAYARGSGRCGSQLPWHAWGEDYYMTHCLDFLGVGRIADFGTLGDQLCTGANCQDGGVAAFHPFKSADAWEGCWRQAVPESR